MDKQLGLFFFFTLFALKTFSQIQTLQQALQGRAIMEDLPKKTTKETIKDTGSVYIRDTIAGYKVISSSLVLLYIGKKYPNQIVTILIKGETTNKVLQPMRSGIGYFTGKVTKYKGKPAIIITDSYQCGMRIMI